MMNVGAIFGHSFLSSESCSGIKILNIEPYDEDERTGYLRYVQVQHVFSLNKS